jgi:flagellar biosynthesis/type III secretory pathway protein FliH
MTEEPTTEPTTLHEEVSAEIERLKREAEESYQSGYAAGFEAGRARQSEEDQFSISQARHYAALVEAANAEVRRLREGIVMLDKKVRAENGNEG